MHVCPAVHVHGTITNSISISISRVTRARVHAACRFCFPCILQWSQIESRCPFCKARFARLVHRRLSAAARKAADPGQAHLDGTVLEVSRLGDAAAIYRFPPEVARHDKRCWPQQGHGPVTMPVMPDGTVLDMSQQGDAAAQWGVHQSVCKTHNISLEASAGPLVTHCAHRPWRAGAGCAGAGPGGRRARPHGRRHLHALRQVRW